MAIIAICGFIFVLVCGSAFEAFDKSFDGEIADPEYLPITDEC